MKKILLLDDNMVVSSPSIDELDKYYEVTRCKEISKAANRLEETDYDLFVIDLMMPPKGLNEKDEFNAGFCFYKQYVKGKYDDVPVLFWTNLNDTPYNEFLEENGKDDKLHYLQKSDDDLMLLDTVNQILGK